MTFVEFNEELNKIDFENGENTLSLDSYLLACLCQLEINKDQEPSFELFLMMYDKARNEEQLDFDPSWKEIEDVWDQPNFSELSDFDKTVMQFQILVADLIHTKEVRSKPNYIHKEYGFEWDSESGLRFFNGTTPSSILKYSATRLVGEYQAVDYQETKVTWNDFWAPIEFGIGYE